MKFTSLDRSRFPLAGKLGDEIFAFCKMQREYLLAVIVTQKEEAKKDKAKFQPREYLKAMAFTILEPMESFSRVTAAFYCMGRYSPEELEGSFKEARELVDSIVKDSLDDIFKMLFEEWKEKRKGKGG